MITSRLPFRVSLSFFLALFVLFVSLPGVVRAQAGGAEGGWRLGLRGSYRSFNDVEFGTQNLGGFGAQGQGTYVDGPEDDQGDINDAVDNNGPYGIQQMESFEIPDVVSDPSTTVNGTEVTVHPYFELVDDTIGVTIPLDTVEYKGVDESTDGGAGVGIVAERLLRVRGNWNLSLAAGFNYFGLDASVTESGTTAAPGNFNFEQYEHVLVDVENGVMTDDDHIIGVFNPVTGDPVATPTGSSAFSVKNEMDLSVFVIDAGCRFSYMPERWGLDFAIGPTLTICDMDTAQTVETSWSEIEADPGVLSEVPVTIAAGEHSEKRSDSTTDILLGGYVSLGLSCDITERFRLGAALRYDFVGSDASTDQADLELSGSSGELRAEFAF